MRTAGLALAIVLTFAVAAGADPITYQLSGTVTSFFSDPSLAFNASAGDRFVAFLTVPSAGWRNGGVNFDDGHFSMNAGTGGFEGTSGGFADVTLDGPNDQARFVLEPIPTGFTDESGHAATLSLLALFDTGASGRPFLTTDALPTAAELNNAPRGLLTLGPDCCTTPFFMGSIEHVSGGPIAPTPEPASLVLLALSLGTFVLVRRPAR